MRTNGKQPVVLLALNRVDQAADIAALIGAGLERTQIEPGHGCFEGKIENSYAIPVEAFTESVRSLLRKCNQQCVSFLDNQYNAWLATAEHDYTGYNADGEHRAVYVGEFREVNQATAEKSPGYSQFGGKYYVARR